MQGKNIKIHLAKKLNDWANSVDDPKIAEIILTKTIISGGCIVSLLNDEEPKDYDVYIKDIDSLLAIANYYVEKYRNFVNEFNIEDDNNEEDNKNKCEIDCIKDLDNFCIQKCIWNDELKYWRVLKDGDILKDTDGNNDIRIRCFIRSIGTVGEYIEENFKNLNKIKKDANKKYFPKYFTNNAITLSDKIQLVLRFYGDADKIRENFDFVHCTSYYDNSENILELPSRALEAILNKEFYYIGSKYPLCSIIRTRKFIKRGYTINAGQYLKMVLQLNQMDLTNIHILEEQLIGVDSSYFSAVINNIKKDYIDKDIDASYLIKVVNKVFDNGIDDNNED